ncbi:hypothetical protein [uncultured Dokdonia sp.]|uniref:hypothetical protein n=1 Tax=uncultured Dokdonia sp. TaxID=575653 RepID=UPI0026180ED0|nr:hypothetical protein [uncultured Dokdonia sp.]
MIKKFVEKYYNKYIGYTITAILIIIRFLWIDSSYLITFFILLYIVGTALSTYHKVQYKTGAKPDDLYFSTTNDRLNDIPEILTSLFYMGFIAMYLFIEADFLGVYGYYILITYAILSIYSSFHGKMPSASFSLDRETHMLEYDDDGDHDDEVLLSDIKEIIISPESIILDVTDTKINLIHLSLDEKEMRLVSNYCKSKLRITPTLLTKEEAISLQ